ncbi:MAG: hypothetical protein ACJ76J_01780 [Thermoanaerobaculia bacterium]
MLKVRRVLSVLCLLVFLGLPLAAQTQRESVSPFAGFLEAFWARLTAPLAPITAIWQADGAEDPDPAPTPNTGGGWDPFG